jgi:hypothetical protein
MVILKNENYLKMKIVCDLVVVSSALISHLDNTSYKAKGYFEK